jgi:choline dehydrogenase-like flavoprotein
LPVASTPARDNSDASPLRRPGGSPIVARSTVRAAVAIAEALFARDRRPPAADRLAWIEREVEDFLARSGVQARLMVSLMIWLVSLVAPVLVGRFGLLGTLALGVRVRALVRLEERWGAPLLAVKALLCILYYEHPDAAQEVGFDGLCLLPRVSAPAERTNNEGDNEEIVEGRTIAGDLEDSADVVIVGSGAGGAVVAAHLAEAGQQVIVVEQGPHVPQARYGKMRPSESLRHIWRDGGLTVAVGLGETPLINVMMGECIGGSSVLTGGVCFRTPASILREWSRDLGLVELSEEGMAPYFEDVERSVHVEQVPIAMRSESTRLFGRGADKLGHPLSPLRRNTKNCHGCGRCNFGCPEDAKMSVDRTYLWRAAAAGARIYSDLDVERIATKGARVAGVVGRVRNGPNRRPRGRFTIHAKRVVVAAGAYCTPLLLERSGVGRQSQQLGRNLTLHPSFRIMARFDQRIEGWKGSLQSAYCGAFEHERINLVGLFVPPGVLAGTMVGVGNDQAARAAAIPHLAVFGGMIHDDPGGRVLHVGGRRVMTYRMSRRDAAAISRVLSLTAETFFAAGAREVYLPVLGFEPCDADRFRSLDLDRLPRRRFECSSQHPLGTARMGVSPEHSVVDADGACWELPGLFVADGSVIPTSLGVNPQETVMAMATRIAWKLREQT